MTRTRTRIHPRRFPTTPRTRGPARAGATRRPSTRPGSRSPRSRSRWSRASRTTRRRGSTRRSRRSQRVRRSCWPLGSRRGRRSRLRSSAGTRCSRFTSRAAATTTRGSARLLLAALATQARGAGWALGAAVKWVPYVLLPLHALAARRRAGLGAFAVTTVAVAALATWRYGFAWLDAFGPLADNARETTSYALPHRLSQLGVPEGAAIALFAVLFALVYVGARARGVARPCAARAGVRRVARLRAVRHAVVPRVGRSARGRRGGQARTRAGARVHGVPASADDSRLNTSTPSSSKTGFQSGSRRRRAIAIA